MDSCLICCEDFNQSIHKQVSCPWCQFVACRSCCQTYILDQNETVCMNKSKKPDGSFICQKKWSRKFSTDINNYPAMINRHGPGTTFVIRKITKIVLFGDLIFGPDPAG